MKVAQHFSAGLAFKRCVRPVRDDRKDPISSFMPLEERTRTAVDRPYRDGPLLKHQPTTDVVGYFHPIPPGSILTALICSSGVRADVRPWDYRPSSMIAQSDSRASLIYHLSFVICHA